jgi:hypothetical protein
MTRLKLLLLAHSVCFAVASYHFPPGTFEPSFAFRALLGCSGVDAAVADGNLNEAVDRCFDAYAAGTCAEAVPYVGYGTVRGSSTLPKPPCGVHAP